MSKYEKPACPECGSHDVLPIVYGLPGPELEGKAIMGEVMLGGCVVFGNDPDLGCRSCGAQWLDRRPIHHFRDTDDEEAGPA
ncbi:MAG: hypothetical protein L0213_02970 [Candidatus Dadabacteria bacterium]|nr:hypothetical protein [Candidatus Dadabacteria bacterium]